MPMKFEVNYPLNYLELDSVECCGWIQVSEFGMMHGNPTANDITKQQYTKVLQDLDTLGEDGLITCENEWSHVEGQEVEFTLFCVLAAGQYGVYHEDLVERGWKPLPSFLNPNTDNRCYPYMFIPKHLE